MADKRALRGDDVFHMTLASATGAMSPVDVPISLDEVAAYVMAKMKAEAAPVDPTAPVPPAA